MRGLTGLSWLKVVSVGSLFLIWTMMNLSVLSVQSCCPPEQLSAVHEVSYSYLAASPL